MAAFCIQPKLAAQLKEAARQGDITMQKLFDMSSEERNSLFGKFTDHETATQINAGFEKAMSSSQQLALTRWVKRTFDAKDTQSGRKADVIDKINNLREQGLLTPESEKAFLSDLVATKLGVTVTAKEAQGIAERAGKLADLQKEIGNGVGDPTENPKGQEAYLKARSDLNNYIASLTPSSNIKVAIGTIGRGMMVTTLHSPTLNIISHAIISMPEAIIRRIETRQFAGFNNGFANKYIANADRLFSKTGYDISRFEALGGERKSMGEEFTHSQGPGPIRWMGRLVENTVFAHLHGDLYEKFASRHFADSVNLQTTALAKAMNFEGQAAKDKALALFKDAVLLEPKTSEGKAIRAKAQADALYATFTNKSVVSEAALGLRTVANKATGDFRLGDITIPFAKVPANALGASLDYAGVPMTAKLATGIAKTLGGIASGKGFEKGNFAGLNRAFLRFGLGLTFAAAISELVKPENFIGAYPTSPSEQKLLNEENGVTNSVKVGNKWISLDYLGNEGAALLGLLYAKKYGGNTPLDYVYRYSQGPSSVLQNIPGLSELANVYKYLNTPPSQKTTGGAFAQSEAKTILATITARIIPGFVSDIAKMTDQYARATDKTSPTSAIQSNIPGLREGLPISKDLFGDAQKTEPWLSQAFFGSRVKTAQDSQLLNELVRLDQAGELPSITDVAKSSKSMVNLKAQIGSHQFEAAMNYFGTNLKQNMTDTINSDDYKTADSPLAQKTMLDKVKEQTLKDTLSQYNYTPPEKP